MLALALTGGIASGKSTASQLFESLGAYVVDADQLARRVIEPGSPALEEIREYWPETVTHTGLDRKALAHIVFNDEEALARLNSITHPAIQALFDAELAAFSGQILIYDMPLLYGSAVELTLAANIVISSPEHTRIQRMVTERGMSENEALARIRNQPTDEERVSIADVVIANNTSPGDFLNALKELWHTWIIPFAENMSGEIHRLTQWESGVTFASDADLHIRRLKAHGIEAKYSSQGLICRAKPEACVLASCGWVMRDGHAQLANPAICLDLRWEC